MGINGYSIQQQNRCLMLSCLAHCSLRSSTQLESDDKGLVNTRAPLLRMQLMSKITQLVEFKKEHVIRWLSMGCYQLPKSRMIQFASHQIIHKTTIKLQGIKYQMLLLSKINAQANELPLLHSHLLSNVLVRHGTTKTRKDLYTCFMVTMHI